ncbi:YggS family pyridoxal phosphate-dependent enzyme [Segniliparus rugosus]|uniref:Pyridoxal phosphate homeostasis protein n=1 Tax=Segniliparus rugosus (strain ATCC BAA-974 / DSM 45345 / CCUG 50838 / CIP 108380 / JCM 13579 / CDC 945) TaxID=679197 RepID=E5XTN3_SEGRC|nr:YggS family pyridoxal phosphate-dependent enzyme [Segniliparus rugosus]EFV12295.1 YggS family pyridoxal phosphate enzyme [Segniliparus rugosus ATCC BAA-974]
MSRRAELAERLASVREQVAEACARAGRDAREVTLVVVTKFFPASDAALLYELGCREFGESRDQEARAKVAELGDSVPGVRWHMIGQIQRNKAKSIASWAHVVQSVDEARLVAAFEKAVSERGGQPLDVLVQVSLDGDGRRSGALPEDVPALADQIAASEHLRLQGLMAIPPLAADPAQAYERLARLHDALKADHPSATTLSAGMSGDFATAIAAGSSCVRVGTAILGARPIPSP